MEDDISTYIIQLKKMQCLIFIDIFNKCKFKIDFCTALFDQYTNKYHVFKSILDPKDIIKLSTIEILLYHNIIEQTGQELPPKFVLTKTVLISLL